MCVLQKSTAFFKLLMQKRLPVLFEQLPVVLFRALQFMTGKTEATSYLVPVFFFGALSMGRSRACCRQVSARIFYALGNVSDLLFFRIILSQKVFVSLVKIGCNQ